MPGHRHARKQAEPTWRLFWIAFGGFEPSREVHAWLMFPEILRTCGAKPANGENLFFQKNMLTVGSSYHTIILLRRCFDTSTLCTAVRASVFITVLFARHLLTPEVSCWWQRGQPVVLTTAAVVAFLPPTGHLRRVFIQRVEPTGTLLDLVEILCLDGFK